jgi:hypothetical protein
MYWIVTKFRHIRPFVTCMKLPRLILQILILLNFASGITSHAQTLQGRVLEKGTGESLAFVSIVEQGTVNGTYSDIDGYFTITLIEDTSAVLFNLIGYESLTYQWISDEPVKIILTEKNNLLQEIVIRPGVNPAERIMRRAIENRRINNPESDIAFTYDSYNKLVFGANPDSLIMADSSKFAKLDSSTQAAYNYLSAQYLFMMESATRRKFYPPDHSEETIIANRVSGLKSTDFFLLGTQLQSFSFYGQTVDLMSVSYMSPLADNAISKYLFVLEDTTYIGVDTVFTISFQPRKGKNFDGMKGQLFINTNGFAIQNVIAEPAESSAAVIKIQQQYEFVENRKWFPKQLNSSIQFVQIIVSGTPMTGEGRSYIKNLQLDAPLKRAEFTPVALLMAPKAGSQPDSVWMKYRERELDTKELKTYQFIDSIGKEINLDRKMKGIEALTTGQINLGLVSFDLNRLLAYNQYEKFRLGGGLRTSNLLSEKFSVGGYYAYGFGDKHSKYGGDAVIQLYRKRNAWLKFLYQNDVMELGGNQLDKPVEGLGLANIYPFFISRMDRREKYEAQINSRVFGNLTANVFMNQQFVRAFDTYLFNTVSSENVDLFSNQFNTTEAGVQLRFAPGEKLVRMQNREVSLGGYFPVFLVRYTRGMKNILDGDFDYSRIDFRMEKTFRILNVGALSVVALAGYVPDNIPLSLLYNARGTYGRLTIASANTFETMRTNEFQHSKFAGLHIRHNFGKLLVKSKYFAPTIVLVHSMLWGEMDHAQSHNYEVSSASLGYTESGLEINNILMSNFSGLGVGMFYRYGAYHLTELKDNIAIKITSAFTF